MKFTVKQLFSIIDGRLSTEMIDVYEILNAATGEQLMTHQLPVAMKYLGEVGPDWYVKAHEQLAEIKQKVGDDFQVLMRYIDEMLPHNYHEVIELTKDQREGFGKYMVDNSLLLR